MKYVEETATPGEMIMGSATFSWLFLALAMTPFWILLLILYAVLQVLGRQFGGGVIPGYLINYGFIAVILIGGFRYLSVALPWVYTEIAVTNRRIVYRHGFFARQVEEVAINRIEGVNMKQPMMGRMFNFGSLNIYGIGVDHVQLPPIADPLHFRKAIQEAINESQSTDARFN